ncbi:conserved hypothetical protein [Altererythrobacter sp. B11]|uniref:SPOR domain-containing protein n=1 Tax=Altererythrobacter sp. B11 TaxID=2060312 RepID=UPI000DC711BB|nr:SPOR domain-containing protein [Altererythrobacter sp. B11]BBC74159.1 conserved hypothetical protein [Altererythrobacter sp. B11]
MVISADGRTDGGTGDPDGSGAAGAEEELIFADADERLPWLESDDDYEPAGVDSTRIIAFAAGLAVLLLLVIGGVWWVNRDTTGADLVADGSVIEAPDEPYKTKPEDPGGKQVAGTGDTSFEVAEGKVVETRIADKTLPATPAAAEPSAAPSATQDAGSGGVGVQVGAYATREYAQRGWDTLNRRFDALNGYHYRVVEAMVDGTRVYRLQAVAGDATSAYALCERLKAGGADCQVKR